MFKKFPHCQPAAVPQLCQYKSFLDHSRNWITQMTTLRRKETPNANHQELSSLIQYSETVAVPQRETLDWSTERQQMAISKQTSLVRKVNW